VEKKRQVDRLCSGDDVVEEGRHGGLYAALQEEITAAPFIVA
jgi:hypothetical protein